MKVFFSQTTSLALLLFVITAVYNIVLDIQKDMLSLKQIEIVKEQLHQTTSNSKMVLELQRERGLTNIYFANATEEHKEKMLLQRAQTASVILPTEIALNKSLDELRKQVDAATQSREYIFNYYSELVRNLLLDTRTLTYESDDKVVKNELSIYSDLNSLQEILGQLRAKVGLVLSSNILTPEAEVDIKRSNILFQHQLERTFINDILSSRKYTRKISKTKCLKKSFLISKTLKLELEKGESRLSAIEWFKISTCAIDTINGYVDEQLKIIEVNIEEKIEILRQKRVKNFIFWLFGFGILSIFVYIAIRSSIKLRKEQALLRNYKKAIDYSSMVFISDKDGKITHVNDNISTTSGYSESELLGKKYDIIIDPETSLKKREAILISMQTNKLFGGIIKNRAKNGDAFWADTFIVPILDDKDNLVEHITIGCDISEILHLNDEIMETQRELLYRLGEAVESRNKESGNHIKRVAHYSRLLAKLSNLSDQECEIIFAASSMHDVGKIAIPDAILLKPDKLTEDEWSVMQTHSEIGYGLFKDSTRPILMAAADISYQHHEFYNGKGYPRGLKGEEISIFGRIVAIADVFDALCSSRPYKTPWELEKVLALFEEESGEQFDPRLVELFLDNIDQFLEIQNSYK